MTQSYSTQELEDDLGKLISMGFPTFDEFKKDPDKYRGRKDEVFESVQNSVHSHRELLSKQRYFWRYGKDNFPLEKLESVCREEGYAVDQVDVLPMRQAGHDGKDEIIVRFFPRHELKTMGATLPNG